MDSVGEFDQGAAALSAGRVQLGKLVGNLPQCFVSGSWCFYGLFLGVVQWSVRHAICPISRVLEILPVVVSVCCSLGCSVSLPVSCWVGFW